MIKLFRKEAETANNCRANVKLFGIFVTLLLFVASVFIFSACKKDNDVSDVKKQKAKVAVIKADEDEEIEITDPDVPL